MTFAPDFGILRQAYLTPLQHPMAAPRIFWPFLLLYETADQLLGNSDNIKAVFGFDSGWVVLVALVLILLSWPLFAAGAIRWHRWLILGEPPTASVHTFKARTRAYFWRTFLLAVCTLPLMSIWLGLGIAINPTPSAKGTDGDHAQLFGWLWGFYLPAIDLMVVAFLARFVLRLPAIALEPSDGAKAAEPPQATSWRLTLLLATLPLSILYSLPTLVFPKLTPDAASMPDGILPLWAIALDSFDNLLLALLLFYGALVFLSTLSLWYAKHERPQLHASAA